MTVYVAQTASEYSKEANIMAEEHPGMDIPKWDIALANLAREECEKLHRPLQLDDFTRLANDYAIRLDDIMVTMFELVIHQHWEYDGPQTVTRDTLNQLYVGGRLHAKDLEPFTGQWRPVQT